MLVFVVLLSGSKAGNSYNIGDLQEELVVYYIFFPHYDTANNMEVPINGMIIWGQLPKLWHVCFKISVTFCSTSILQL